jgi:hypothetical protein
MPCGDIAPLWLRQEGYDYSCRSARGKFVVLVQALVDELSDAAHIFKDRPRERRI